MQKQVSLFTLRNRAYDAISKARSTLHRLLLKARQFDDASAKCDALAAELWRRWSLVISLKR